jgi:hypothetical protein
VQAALAAIHRAETTAPGLAEQDPLAQWREMLDAMADTTATFEWAFRWLAANRPRRRQPAWCTATSGWAT